MAKVLLVMVWGKVGLPWSGSKAERTLPGELSDGEREKEEEEDEGEEAEEGESATGGYYAPDFKVDELPAIPSVKDWEPPEIPDVDEPFTLTLPGVPYKSGLLERSERAAYVSGVVMPSRRKEMAGRTTDSFHDHGREIAIQYMSWQDDNFRSGRLWKRA
uniref:uncharacterized protein LOC122600286 n=1 Tax=Erigeron canadensis TaxID=72917 RepID=UPI001CB8909D|nr:uncharacterized protein LOC122600286 [Erigeron canadensis]